MLRTWLYNHAIIMDLPELWTLIKADLERARNTLPEGAAATRLWTCTKSFSPKMNLGWAATCWRSTPRSSRSVRNFGLLSAMLQQEMKFVRPGDPIRKVCKKPIIRASRPGGPELFSHLHGQNRLLHFVVPPKRGATYLASKTEGSARTLRERHSSSPASPSSMSDDVLASGAAEETIVSFRLPGITSPPKGSPTKAK